MPLDLNIETQKSIVDALPHAAFILDRSFIIQCANDIAEKLFERNLLGIGYVHILRQPEALELLDRTVGTGSFQSLDMVLRLHQPRTFRLSAAFINGEQPQQHILAMLTDISAEMDAERARSMFVANVSHELRSPITSLMGIVETLRGPARKDVEATGKFLDLMDAEAGRMSRLVGDLLSLSKLESKEHLPPEGLVNLEQIITQVKTILEESNPEYKGRIGVTGGTDITTVRGERDELREVFQNLVENALRYSVPRTPIEISIDISGPDRNRIVVSVQDHSEGIAPEHLPRLTERFYRVDKGRSREMGGTGLGLAISKHIINRHRGRLDIKSTAGEGTTVRVSLPV